jgi:hypothetical protein
MLYGLPSVYLHSSCKINLRISVLQVRDVRPSTGVCVVRMRAEVIRGACVRVTNDRE